jgi:hypothetical protein
MLLSERENGRVSTLEKERGGAGGREGKMGQRMRGGRR